MNSHENKLKLYEIGMVESVEFFLELREDEL